MKILFLAALLSLAVACEPAPSSTSPAATSPSASTSVAPPSPSPSRVAGTEPDHITVQHLLVSFRGCRTKATRSQEEAKELAEKLYLKARNGENFDELIKQYTDDSPPGIYKMSNKGVAKGQGEFERTGMVPAFGNVGFKLKVGEFGMSVFDQKDSPFGWHIIKRVD